MTSLHHADPEARQVEAMKYTFIPVSHELITHVRCIDGFSVSSSPSNNKRSYFP